MPDLLPKTHLYPEFREHDALNAGLTSGFVGLGAGLFSACMKNAYFSTSASAWTVFSVYGATIPIYGAAFGAYGLTKVSLANLRRKNDGWNEFAGGASGGLLWSIFRGQKISNIVAVTVATGTAFGLFGWAGGLGGFGAISGVDIHKALEYRRNWRWYPTHLIPMEDYEKAIGRKVHPEDFADINAILGEERPALPNDIVGVIPVSKPDRSWWKDVLEKARAVENKNKQ